MSSRLINYCGSKSFPTTIYFPRHQTVLPEGSLTKELQTEIIWCVCICFNKKKVLFRDVTTSIDKRTLYFHNISILVRVHYLNVDKKSENLEE